MKLSRVLFPLLLLTVTGHAQKIVTPGQVEIRALHGLPSVSVEVNGDSGYSGFSTGEIRKSVERKLKTEGLPVVGVNAPRMGTIKVTLSRSKTVVLVRVQLMRAVSIDCDGNNFLMPLWERQAFSDTKGVSDSLAALVDEFAEDFNSINRR